MSLSSQDEFKSFPRPYSPVEKIIEFSKIKLIAFDLDGTLLKDPDGSPGQRIAQLQKSIMSYGVQITLATGRTLWGAKKTIAALGGLSNIPIALYNGGVVAESNSHLLQRKTMGPDITLLISSIALNFNSVVFVYSYQENIFNFKLCGDSVEVVYLLNPSGENVKEFNGMATVLVSKEFLLSNNVEACAILILPVNETCSELICSEINKLSTVSVTSSGSKYIEIRPAGVSKADGVRVLALSKGLTADQILAVGDNDNDVELFCWAGLSVAVKEGSSAAKKAATYVSTRGAEEAAIEVLDVVRLAHRYRRGIDNARKPT